MNFEILTISTIVSGVLIFLSQLYIIIINHFNNKKIEKFRSELATVMSLQQIMVNGRLSRQMVIDKRRFEAIDNLSISLKKIDQMVPLSVFLMAMNLDKTLDELKLQKHIFIGFKNSLGSSFIGTTCLRNEMLNFHDHYLFEKVFNLYLFYKRMILIIAGIIELAIDGYDPREIYNFQEMNDIVLKYHPDSNEFIENNGNFAWMHYLHSTREMLSLDIRSFISEIESDYSDIVQQVNMPQSATDSTIYKTIQNIPAAFKSKKAI